MHDAFRIPFSSENARLVIGGSQRFIEMDGAPGLFLASVCQERTSKRRKSNSHQHFGLFLSNFNGTVNEYPIG
jgi:hypothetical protein